MKDKAGFACPITPDICVDQERLLEIAIMDNPLN